MLTSFKLKFSRTLKNAIRSHVHYMHFPCKEILRYKIIDYKVNLFILCIGLLKQSKIFLINGERYT